MKEVKNQKEDKSQLIRPEKDRKSALSKGWPVSISLPANVAIKAVSSISYT